MGPEKKTMETWIAVGIIALVILFQLLMPRRAPS
jgi:hypothetical protein